MRDPESVTDNSQVPDSHKRRREQAFLEEAAALRTTLVHYMEGELADGQLRDAAQRVIRDSFKDLVQQTLKQSELHRRISSDLVSALLEGLRQSLPNLQDGTLAKIRTDLESQWSNLLPKLTEQALKNVVEQQLIPRNLPEILRRSLTDAFTLRSTELRQEIEIHRKKQIEELRRELHEMWHSSLQSILQQALEQAVSENLAEGAVRKQVEVAVKEHLSSLNLEIQGRLDLKQIIGHQQSNEVDRVRRDIEMRWREELPSMVQQGLSSALNQELRTTALTQTISRHIETAVSEQICAIEQTIHNDLQSQERIKAAKPQLDLVISQQLDEYLNQSLPSLLSTSIENALLNHLTSGTLDQKLGTLVDERLARISGRQVAEKSEMLEENTNPLEPVVDQGFFSQQEPLSTAKPNTEAPLSGSGLKTFIRSLATKAANQLRMLHPSERKILFVIIIGMTLLLAALAYTAVERNLVPNQLKQRPPQEQPARNKPTAAQSTFSIEQPWKELMSEEENELLNIQGSQPLRADELFTCWYKGNSTQLEQTWNLVRQKAPIDVEVLKNIFPACASLEVRDKAALFSAQLAVKHALALPTVQKACQAADKQAVTRIDIPTGGVLNDETRKGFDLFLRCANLDSSLQPEAPTRLHHLFLAYIALRKAEPPKK